MERTRELQEGQESALESDLLEMLRRCALFRALARAFATPQAGKGEPALDRELRALAAAQEWPAELAAALEEAACAWQRSSAAERSQTYVRSFATDQRCPLHETAYGDAQRLAGKSAELADLQGFYRAFAVSPERQRADHLSVELEFYSVLLFKEAWARAEGWKEQASITRSAARQFLGDHLGRWVRAVAEEAQVQNVASPYPEVLRLVCAAVESEVARLGVRVEPLRRRASADPLQSDEFHCDFGRSH